MICIILLGPPGAGKGTQGQLIASQFSIPAISTGEIFRAHVASGTALGHSAKAFLDAGDLVPDALTCAMLAERLADPDTQNGFLLDGFPRSTVQAELLQDMLAEHGHRLYRVVELQVDEAKLVQRLSTRRVVVDGRSVQRDDDAPDTVRHRLEVYRRQTASLTSWYDALGLLSRVDADGDVDEVTARILALFGGELPVRPPVRVAEDRPR
jgi:adenylate kinase